MDLTNGQRWAIILGSFGVVFTILTGGVSHLEKVIDSHYVTKSFMNTQLHNQQVADDEDMSAQMHGCENLLNEVMNQAGK